MKNKDVGLCDYPLGSKRPELIEALSGMPMENITLSAVVNNEIDKQDIRISPRTLLMQAEIASKAGRKLLADNFKRAAELCCLPDEKVLDIYQALRPFRCSKKELEAIAVDLSHTHEAVLCAELIREAAEIYEIRGLLRECKDDDRGI